MVSEEGNDLEQAREEPVREDSDELLAALDKLRRVEAEKRETPFLSPEFNERVREVEDEARRVFRLATREEVHGEQVPEKRPRGADDARAWPSGTSAGAAEPVGEEPRSEG